MALYIGNTRYCLVIGKENTLPYDAEVEYLESTGTQYINSGVQSGTNVIFTTDGIFTSYTNTDNNFGCVGSGGSSRYHFGIYSNKFIFGVGNQYKNTVSADNTRHLFVLNGSGESKLDSNTQLNTTFSGTPYDIILFARKDEGSVENTFCYFKLYSCQISVNNTLVRDFIPVRIGNIGYLYDRVNGNLFCNSGTGNFTLGPDVT